MNDMLTIGDLQVIAEEPRILDLRVAERLEMAQPLDIRRTIEGNRAELERYGEVFAHRPKTSAKGGRPATEYWLNEAQTLLLCMFSRTERAADVRQEVISVYLDYRQGRARARAALSPMPEVTMKFEDYADITRSLIAGTMAQSELLRQKQSHAYSKDGPEVIKILIVETDLSDEDIAERLRGILGIYAPEMVAYHRRKLATGD